MVNGETWDPEGRHCPSSEAGRLGLGASLRIFTRPPPAPSGACLGLWAQQLPSKGPGHRVGAAPGEEACFLP